MLRACRSAVAFRRGVPSVVMGAGVFFKGKRFGLVTPPFRMQNFLWAFREMFALLGNVLQLLDK